MREKPFKIVFGPAAVRDIEGLEAAEAIPLIKEIQTYLETRPIPIGKPRIKKLAGFEPPLYRLRIGDFRAYYRISGDEVVILGVSRRKDSDKRLKRIAEEDGPGYGRKRGRARRQ